MVWNCRVFLVGHFSHVIEVEFIDTWITTQMTNFRSLSYLNQISSGTQAFLYIKKPKVVIICTNRPMATTMMHGFSGKF